MLRLTELGWAGIGMCLWVRMWIAFVFIWACVFSVFFLVLLQIVAHSQCAWEEEMVERILQIACASLVFASQEHQCACTLSQPLHQISSIRLPVGTAVNQGVR